MSLSSSVAIVTGSSGGIGRAIAVRLAQAGAALCINYRSNPTGAEEVKSEIISGGGRAIRVQADVSKVADLQRLIAETVNAFGKLDILVNNAGIETRTSILDTTENDYDRVMDVNLKSAFFGTQLAANQMIKQGRGGRIINISSVHEDWPMPGNTAYCLTKGGMRMLTRTAGVELAAHGITVVGVGPGAVATPINESTLADPQKLAALNATIPLKRLATPGEIADLVVWLASPAASYVTATTYFVDGGIMQFSPGL